jgi:hypothetical protein
VTLTELELLQQLYRDMLPPKQGTLTPAHIHSLLFSDLPFPELIEAIFGHQNQEVDFSNFLVIITAIREMEFQKRLPSKTKTKMNQIIMIQNYNLIILFFFFFLFSFSFQLFRRFIQHIAKTLPVKVRSLVNNP